MSTHENGRRLSYMLALREALQEEMRRDAGVIILGEDVARHGGGFGLTRDLWEEFGDLRVINTPISENGFVGAALGAAMTGARPVVEIMFADFAALAIDQICNEAAKVSYMYGGQTSAPLVVRLPQGGLSWKSAGAHHSQSLEAWYVHIPGLKVIFPSTPYDAKGLMKAAIRDDNPVVFIEHKALYSLEGPVPEDEYLVPIGKADVKRTGRDVTVLASGYMVHFALEAAKTLAGSGIETEVIDLRSLKPLDEECIYASVRKTHRVVLVQEAPKTAGVAAEWGMLVQENCFDWLDAPITRLAGKDVPIPYASTLESQVWPRPEDIVQAVKEVCYFPEGIG
ncbi:MAG: alpha-ketoacid dehydrogenase subunit beta [Anaerolineales bacterium]|jgi:pyruvate/2-oxoglutarate/acetoin dehydrogenase E1 component